MFQIRAQFIDCHAVLAVSNSSIMATTSSIDHSDLDTPAAIAGVMRRV
jgi:hypothetical protein